MVNKFLDPHSRSRTISVLISQKTLTSVTALAHQAGVSPTVYLGNLIERAIAIELQQQQNR